ncbi:MAG TPA: long-chain fatty acid--CoA ligase [Alphaproteobacteria bacterium]|jgi:long-chain acyl-CoA synthetase
MTDGAAAGVRPDARPTGALPKIHPTVVHMLAEAAAEAGDRPALVCGETRLSYTEYVRCVGGFAHALRKLGAGAGERVALLLGNSAEMAIAMFAVHAASAQAVPLNPIYTERELRYILADAAPVAIVHGTETETLIARLAAELGIKHALKVGPGGDDLIRWRGDANARLPEPLPDPRSFATLQYTGGTTGRPKGVNNAHDQMAINLSQRDALIPGRMDGERVLCVMPLFHVFAVSTGLHLAAYCRGTLVILPRYKPDLVLDALERERITVFAAGPTVFNGLIAHERFGATDFSHLRLSHSGSAPLPESTLTRWETATGSPILEGYGQTEAGPVLTFNPEFGVRKPGSVGIPVPLTEVEIVDVETGTRVLGVGEQGEIRARGPQIMSGYRNLPKETAETLRDGWLYTGDIGEFDRDGYLYIRDRKKDMAIVGGYNVYPREVDDVLYGHPSVLEAAAVGVPDDYRGEVIRAYVVFKPDAPRDIDALLDHCRANLAKYKVPTAIVPVEALPKTPVGKIDKKALRALQA